MSGDGVAIGFGDRLLRLHGRPVVAGPVPPPLTAQVDGMAVACVHFARNGHPKAAEVVRRLQQGGLACSWRQSGLGKTTRHRPIFAVI